MTDPGKLDGKRVTARPAGWDEVLPPESDLDPYDGPTDEMEGVLAVRDVPAYLCYPRYTQYLIDGHDVDPKTIRPAPAA